MFTGTGPQHSLSITIDVYWTCPQHSVSITRGILEHVKQQYVTRLKLETYNRDYLYQKDTLTTYVLYPTLSVYRL